MIATEVEYQVTSAAAHRFEEALAQMGTHNSGQDELLFQVMRESIVGQLNDLYGQLRAYEARQDYAGR